MAEVSRDHGGRDPSLQRQRAGKIAQAAVQQPGGRLVRPGPQRGFGQRRPSGRGDDPAAEGALPQLLAALAAQGGQDPGGEERGRGQLVRVAGPPGVQESPGGGTVGAGRRPGAAGLPRRGPAPPRGRARRAAGRGAGYRGGARRGGRDPGRWPDRRCRRSPERARSPAPAPRPGRAARRPRPPPRPCPRPAVIPGPAVFPGPAVRPGAVRRSTRPGGDGRRVRRGLTVPHGHDLDAGPVGVPGHVQHPAGPDQAGDGEAGAVRLHPVRVQVEDLPVPAAVAQVLLRDLPQALVEPADRAASPRTASRLAASGPPAAGWPVPAG